MQKNEKLDKKKSRNRPQASVSEFKYSMNKFGK